MATEDMDAALARALQEEEFAAARAAPQQHAHGDLIAQLNSSMDKVIKVRRPMPAFSQHAPNSCVSAHGANSCLEGCSSRKLIMSLLYP